MTHSLAADGAFASSALLDPPHGKQPVQDPVPEDQDTGDLPAGVDEDTLNEDDLDTDQIAHRD